MNAAAVLPEQHRCRIHVPIVRIHMPIGRGM
jgi:hypothetical protein